MNRLVCIYNPMGDPERPRTAAPAGPTPCHAYGKPAVFDLGSLEKLQGYLSGSEYDGPSRWYFNGF